MSQANMLRKHHKSLGEMALELEKSLGGPPSPAARQAVILVLSRMGGLLALHLAMEDHVMYPLLRAQADGAAAAAARRSFAEVGGLKDGFDAYRTKWMRPSALEASWEAFAAETRVFLESLRERIGREERELFPALDDLGL